MKQHKPTTASRRGMRTVNYSGLTKIKPHKPLTRYVKRRAGRSASQGRITVRHKGGGYKRRYRNVDFKQDKIGIPAKVVSIEYDPSRSAFISLLSYRDGDKRYILAPDGLKEGDIIVYQEKGELKPGNRMMLKHVMVGTPVYNVELIPGKGGSIVRSAGSSAQVLTKDSGFVHLQLPSGEIRMVPEDSFASIGQVSNPEHGFEVVGKAGKKRKRGVRPTVRGSAMNPVDHPHGGGEGRSPIGLKNPKTPWGKIAYGVKTRKKRKYSDKFIIKGRKKKKRK